MRYYFYTVKELKEKYGEEIVHLEGTITAGEIIRNKQEKMWVCGSEVSRFSGKIVDPQTDWSNPSMIPWWAMKELC